MNKLSKKAKSQIDLCLDYLNNLNLEGKGNPDSDVSDFDFEIDDVIPKVIQIYNQEFKIFNNIEI